MGEPRVESTLKALRIKAGLQQRELAARVGVSRQTLGSLEGGETVPSTGLALQLARVLGCCVEDLFHLREDVGSVEAVLAPPSSVPAARDRARAAACRVALASLGPGWVAHVLSGDGALAWTTPADGLMLKGSAQRARKAATARIKPLRTLDALRENLFAAGCDPALGLLGAHLAERFRGARLHWIEAGSGGALEMLAGGRVHVAGLHLFDEASNEFNIGAVRRRFGGRPMMLVNLGVWEQGLVVRAGNPKALRHVTDLAQRGVRFVGREAGSGARELLERLLARARVPASALDTASVAHGHASVAGMVAAGGADAGMATRAAAAHFGLDFVPLAESRFDLAMPKEAANDARVVRLLGVLSSARFRRDIGSLPGYVTVRTGELIAEIAA